MNLHSENVDIHSFLCQYIILSTVNLDNTSSQTPRPDGAASESVPGHRKASSIGCCIVLWLHSASAGLKSGISHRNDWYVWLVGLHN